MEPPTNRVSPEHEALLRFLARVHLDNGAKKLQNVAAAMSLKSKARVSYLLRGENGTLPVDQAQLQALVRGLGGGTDEVARALSLYSRAVKARAVLAAAERELRRRSRPNRQVLIDVPRAIAGLTPALAAPDALIGRQAELECLHGWTAEVAAGRGRAVFVEGEPGIGKSALIRAVADSAPAIGCRVLWGACDELSQAFPLLPLLDAVAASGQADGHRKVTEMLRADLDPDRRVDRVAAAMEQVLALVDQLCLDAPVVLVVDDLQWADPATAQTFGRLARLTRWRPLLLVGLARPVPRRDDLGLLRRLVEPAARLRLRSLSDAEVATFLQAAAGGVPGPRLLRLAAGAAGNPLYLTELVDALIRARALTGEEGRVDAVDGPAPKSLSAAIADRLEFIPPGVRESLRMAALLGASFSAFELAAISGRRINDLLPMIEEAILAGVLRDGEPELAFRHPLIWAALYEEMPVAVRAALHRDAARALAEGGVVAERVARQLLPALDAQDAAGPGDEWAIRWLADTSQQLVGQAPHVAVPLLQWAVAGAPAGASPHGLLVCRLADALYQVGDATRAAKVATGALARETHPDLVVDLHGTLMKCRALEGRSEESITALEQALVLPGIGPRQRARLLVLIARARRRLGQVEATHRVAEEALAEATIASDSWATGWALAMLALVHGMRGAEAEALPLFDRALAVAEGDPGLVDLRLVLRLNQAAAFGDLDRSDAAIRTAEHAWQEAQDTGNVVRLAQASAVLAELLFDLGRWDEALAQSNLPAPGSKEPFSECSIRGVTALIRLHRDDPAARRDLAAADECAVRLDERVVGSLTLARSLEREQAAKPIEALAVLVAGLSSADEETGADIRPAR